GGGAGGRGAGDAVGVFGGGEVVKDMVEGVEVVVDNFCPEEGGVAEVFEEGFLEHDVLGVVGVFGFDVTEGKVEAGDAIFLEDMEVTSSCGGGEEGGEEVVEEIVFRVGGGVFQSEGVWDKFIEDEFEGCALGGGRFSVDHEVGWIAFEVNGDESFRVI
ncbi:MAG: hypothetical protein NZM05_12730, partial [Chloroherpetonaceae bacterium]|nr:hypothetical protein [Chloroherpetonaceae bacterium]